MLCNRWYGNEAKRRLVGNNVGETALVHLPHDDDDRTTNEVAKQSSRPGRRTLSNEPFIVYHARPMTFHGAEYYPSTTGEVLLEYTHPVTS